MGRKRWLNEWINDMMILIIINNNPRERRARAALLAQPERSEMLWVPANASSEAPLLNQEEELRSLNLLPLLWFTAMEPCIRCHAHGGPASACHNLSTVRSRWHEGGAGFSSHYIRSYVNDVTGHALLHGSRFSAYNYGKGPSVKKNPEKLFLFFLILGQK